METTTIEPRRDKHTNGARTKPAGTKLTIVKATLEEMHLAAKIVSSTAHWYQPFVDEKDMAEHDVGDKWARRNYSIREFFFGKEGDKTVGIGSMQHAGDYVYVGYVYLLEWNEGYLKPYYEEGFHLYQLDF